MLVLYMGDTGIVPALSSRSSWRFWMHMVVKKFGPYAVKVEEQYNLYRTCKKELESFQMDEGARLKEISFLEFEMKEIGNVFV